MFNPNQTTNEYMLDEQALAEMESKLAYENSIACFAEAVAIAEIDRALLQEFA